MNYRKEFFKRGMMFGGFGPIIVAIIYLIVGIPIQPMEYFTSVISSYLLAFLVAGASVFYQIESWGPAKASLFHMLCLYFAYLGCYLINGWIASNIKMVAVFTGIFILGYLVIWTTVSICVKYTARKLNRKLAK